MEHSKRAHAMHNASSADYWMECDLWFHHKLAAEEAGEDFDKPSEAADRGTMCHEASEKVLDAVLAGVPILDSLSVETFLLTEEETDLVQTAVQAALDLMTANEGDEPFEVWTEVELPLSHEPESDGHVDVLAFRPGLVIVADYKFGEMAVSPNAHQLRIYGSNAVKWLDEQGLPIVSDDVVLLAVVQPRLHQEALVRRFRVSELLRYQAHVEHVVEGQLAGDRRGASSLSTCQWCPFRDRCGQYAQLRQNMFGKLKKGVKQLKHDEIEEIVRSRSMLMSIIKELTNRVAEDEATYPNWTRVQVANGRDWTPLLDEGSLARQLEEAGASDLFALRSPAQVRDRNKKLAKLVEQLSVSSGHHIRLYDGAPKSGTPKKEPAKRPVTRGKIKANKKE